MKGHSVGVKIKVDYEDSRFVLYKLGTEIWKCKDFEELRGKLYSTTSGRTPLISPVFSYGLEITDEAKSHLENDQIGSLETRIKQANLGSRVEIDERQKIDDRSGIKR